MTIADLNKTVKSDLKKIKGIGEYKGERIARNKPYKKWKELKEVKYITDTIIERIKDTKREDITEDKNSKENGQKTEIDKIPRREDGTFMKGNGGGPGRPKGSVSFKTKFKRFINKVADRNEMTPEEVEDQMLSRAFQQAKAGNYKFWKDIMDRIYGKPLQHSEVQVKAQVEVTQNDVRKLINELPEHRQKHYYGVLEELVEEAEYYATNPEDPDIIEHG